MKHLVFFFMLLLVSNYSTSLVAQNSSEPITSKENKPFYKEKVYLHLDKSYYNAGDAIWFKAYLINAATHKTEESLKVLYVDLIGVDNSILDSKIIKVENGFGVGDFALPLTFASGTYTVRAYTNYMRNFDNSFFFRKKVFVKALPLVQERLKEQENVSKKKAKELEATDKSVLALDVQFFPESGHMLSDTYNRIGFKALSSTGKGVDVSGNILNDLGEQIVAFKASKFGMGSFGFVPKEGQVYTADVVFNGKSYSYKLPEAVRNTSIIQIQDLDDKYQLNLVTSNPEGFGDYVLIGAQRNDIVYSAKISGNKKKAVLSLSKDVLHFGIVQFTLYNEAAVPVAERLVFNNSAVNTDEITVASSEKLYEKGEMVALEIATKAVNTPIAANLSVSVTDISVQQPRDEKSDIRTYLLLNSEIKGTIENPGYYFYSEDPDRAQHLDLLLMTQGWRKFIFTDFPELKEDRLQYINENGITVKGSVRDYHKPKKTAVATVSLSYKTNDLIGTGSVLSEDNGEFQFTGLDIADKETVILKANDYKRVMKDFKIQLDSFVSAPVLENNGFYAGINAIEVGDYVHESDERSRIDAMFENEIMSMIELDEVLVETKRKTRGIELSYKRKEGSIYSQASNTLDFSTISDVPYKDILDALRSRVPGIEIFGGFITIRGRNSITGDSTPLFLLDGVPVNQEAIENIPIWEVDFIDVLKGSRAAIFGSEGGNGVIAVYTLTGEEQVKQNNSRVGQNGFVHPGFYQSRKFYEPGFTNDSTMDGRPKYTTTLFWEPNITVDKTGKHTFEFPAKSVSGRYTVSLEGITSEGLPVVSETTFSID
ncbi:TonB-dependent receptor plug domain-containing protein [Cellulophaga sp. F20128]|uniref:TonB-dependent receptor n=1 Tax=Cellulophaga sp. F20128 TaxID=2926413 RepID=UPI001FF1E73C|nr:TonB-dependent receptor plug domain-containing protein [Cellulophaga sp. F20128]MCK0158666.1 TonB-dependent receptor plug domain-containing protein [Cellulophaga sp. F20128]